MHVSPRDALGAEAADCNVKYDKTVPCKTCPFLRTGLKLHPQRAEEIGGMMLSTQGGEFPCHMTIEHGEQDETGDARLINRGQEVHCAGALIFAEKNSTATQMMRICERIGIYKPEGIIDSKSWDKVFDDFDEMVSAHTEDWEKSRDKAKEHRNKDGNEHLPVDE